MQTYVFSKDFLSQMKKNEIKQSEKQKEFKIQSQKNNRAERSTKECVFLFKCIEN